MSDTDRTYTLPSGVEMEENTDGVRVMDWNTMDNVQLSWADIAKIAKWHAAGGVWPKD